MEARSLSGIGALTRPMLLVPYSQQKLKRSEGVRSLAPSSLGFPRPFQIFRFRTLQPHLLPLAFTAATLRHSVKPRHLYMVTTKNFSTHPLHKAFANSPPCTCHGCRLQGLFQCFFQERVCLSKWLPRISPESPHAHLQRCYLQ